MLGSQHACSCCKPEGELRATFCSDCERLMTPARIVKFLKKDTFTSTLAQTLLHQHTTLSPTQHLPISTCCQSDQLGAQLGTNDPSDG